MSNRLTATYKPDKHDKDVLIEAKKRSIKKHKKIIARLKDEVDEL